MTDNYDLTDIEIQYSVINTIVNMLFARKTISDKNKYIKLLTDKKNINLDLLELIDIVALNDGELKLAIKFYKSKLTTIKNDKEIESFLATYPNHYKFLIVSDYILKAEKQILEYNNIEIFKTIELIKDISTNFLVPQHILLTNAEKEQFLEEYNFTLKDLPRIFKDDPMVRYLNAKPNDIIHIIRPSATSGYSSFYRLVVNNSIY